MKSNIFLGATLAAMTMTVMTGCEKTEAPADVAPEAVPKAVVESDIVKLPEPMKAEDIVVKVGDTTLTWEALSKEVDSVIDLEVKLSGQPIPTDRLPGLKQNMRRALVQDFVANTIFEQVAAKHNIAVDEAYRAEHVKELEARAGKSFDEIIAASPLGKEKMEDIFNKRLLTEKVIDELVRKSITVSDEEVAAQLETDHAKIALVDAEMEGYEKQLKEGANFEELVKANSAMKQPITPPVSALARIFPPEALAEVTKTATGQMTPILKLPTERMIVQVVNREEKPAVDDAAAKAKLEEIRARILNGEDFATLAAEFSDCPSGKTAGGDLGEFGKGAMVKEFEEAALTQPIGEVGPLVKTSFGYHIVKVTERNEDGSKMKASHILIKTGENPPTITLLMLIKQVPEAMTAEQVREQLTEQRSKQAEMSFFQEQMNLIGVESKLFPELNTAK